MQINPFLTLEQRLDTIETKINSLTSLLQSSREKNEYPSQMSIDELVRYLGNVSKPTVYGWCFHNEIPHFKIGRRLYFKKSEIDVWVSARRRATTTERALKAMRGTQEA